jgi:hypothetical protein
MYPLLEWRQQGATERIHCLNGNGLFYESVIASAQGFEQILKRIIGNELATRGLMIEKIKLQNGSHEFFLIASESLADTVPPVSGKMSPL